MSIDLNKIRENADIVEVISSYLPLNIKGRNHVGVCPFHSDTSPSLTVSKDKQIYKCFACNAAGNVFTFVQEFEKIPFMDAVRKVCEITHQKVEGLEKSVKVEHISDEKKRLYDLMNDLTNFYTYSLRNDTLARNYLEKRKLSNELVNEFLIGYSPLDPKKSISFLKAKGYSIDEILKCGVGYESNGEVLDRYNGRIIFPLKDSYGRVSGFSARRISDNKDEAKYINSGESPLFHKSSILYNYHNASKIAHKEGYVYVVEGFMDALALYEIGYKSVIATMGTALTVEHVDLIRRLNVPVYFSFDNDKAGYDATFKNLNVASKLKEVRVVNFISEYKDLDEHLKALGAESLKKAISKTLSPLEFKFNYFQTLYNLNNFDDRKIYVSKILNELVNSNVDKLDLDFYLNKLASATNFSKEIITSEYSRLKNNASKTQGVVAPKVIGNYKTQVKEINRYEESEKRLIIHMLLDNSVIDIFNEKLGIMRNDAYRKIVACIIRYYSEYGKVSLADIYSDTSIINDPNAKQALNDLDLGDDVGEFSTKYILILTKELELKSKLEIIKQKLSSDLSPNEKSSLLNEYVEIEKELKKIKIKM